MSTSKPQHIQTPRRGSTQSGHSSPAGSYSRALATGRLGSPVRSPHPSTPTIQQIPTPGQLGDEDQSQPTSPVPELDTSRGRISSSPGPSALAAALKQAKPSSVKAGTPRERALSPVSIGAFSRATAPHGNYGSFDARQGSPLPGDNLDIVRRHLAGPAASTSPRKRGSISRFADHDREEVESIAPGLDEDEFSSLRLQGGDVTRPIYRLVEQQAAEGTPRRKSFIVDRPLPDDERLNIGSIKQPGGFRRNYIRRAARSPSPNPYVGGQASSSALDQRHNSRQEPQILTTNFLEFLSLYGHFAGEELDDEDDGEDYFSPETYTSEAEDGDDNGSYGEDSALLGTPGKRRKKRKEKVQHGGSPAGAALLLLKSFVGTGVLFLPKAFLNGGMLFSCLILLGVAWLSYYCFLLLCSTRLKVPASFGGMGLRTYGKPMQFAINFSLVISQIGFSSAYITFVATNLQAFILAVSDCRTFIDIKYLILMQMIIFLPLSLYRNIQNIQKIAVAADVFILAGLAYLWYFDIFTIVKQHGIADIKAFNSNSWTLFIGTAIFTFEGIGLVIPIQESMKEPKKFPFVLALVMVIITVVFIGSGAISYAAFGSKTKTVVLLNMPQDSKFVNAVQFIYSLAILLSTPLQFFPAIEITSMAIFKKTGKNNPYVKWQKNVFRFFMVVFCALIAWLGANDLDKFVAVVGSFACVPLVYIYPPMMHYKAVSTKHWQKIADVLLVVFGVVLMGYTTALTVKSWIEDDGAKPPGYCDDR